MFNLFIILILTILKCALTLTDIWKLVMNLRGPIVL